MVEGLGWGRNPPASRNWKGDYAIGPRFLATGGAALYMHTTDLLFVSTFNMRCMNEIDEGHRS